MALTNAQRARRYRIRQNGLKLRVSIREADVLLRLLKDTPYESLRNKIDEQATEQLRNSLIENMECLREQDEITYDYIEEA